MGLPPCCCRLHWFCKHHCFWWRPYCVVGPVVAFIPAVACVPAVACIPAVVSGHDTAVILNVACCWPYCCCLCHCCCLHPDCGRHSCCCWRPLSSWCFPVAVLSAIADIPGVTNGVVGVSAVPFEHAVAGFPVVKGVFAVASVPADPGVHIFTILDCRMRRITLSAIRLSQPDCNFFLQSNYRNTVSYIILANYWISDQGLNLSDYGLIKTIDCSPLILSPWKCWHFFTGSREMLQFFLILNFIILLLCGTSLSSYPPINTEW
jgi:hypothetical protein